MPLQANQIIGDKEAAEESKEDAKRALENLEQKFGNYRFMETNELLQLQDTVWHLVELRQIACIQWLRSSLGA